MEDVNLVSNICDKYMCDKSIAKALIECSKKTGNVETLYKTVKCNQEKESKTNE